MNARKWFLKTTCLVLVLTFSGVLYAFWLSPRLEDAILNGDWEAVYEVIRQDSTVLKDPVAVLLLAHACDATNRHNESMELFDSVTDDASFEAWAKWTGSLRAKHPENAPVLYLSADAKRHIGKVKEAIEDLSKALLIEENFALAFDARGRAYDDIGDLDQAIADYTNAIAANPMLVVAYFNRGYVYASGKGWYQRAIFDYNRAIELDSTYAKAFNNRGVAYNNIGMYDQAICDYTQAIDIDNKYAKAYNNRGATFNKLGMYDDAIADYDEAIKIKPRYAEAYNNRGVAYKHKAQYDQAISDFDTALEIDANHADALTQRGETYGIMEQFEQAISDYDKALAIDPRYAAAYYNKAIACCHLEKTLEALEAYRAFIKHATCEFDKYIPGVKQKIRKLEEKIDSVNNR